jgi:hypothetical protein
VDKKMRELDSRIAQFEEYQTQQEIEREVGRLKSKYSDFDVTEVVQAAIKAGTTDLEAVYKQVAFDKFSRQRELEAAAVQQKQLQESKVVESKRQASVVEGGASATASTTTDSYEPVNSISDAWAAAKRQLNANF